jgi:hypothetical protein
MKEQLFKKYIRDEKHKPHGVAVAIVNENGTARFGYSLCNPCDQFNKKMGTEIAIRRAQHPKTFDDNGLLPLEPERRAIVASKYDFLSRRIEERALYQREQVH